MQATEATILARARARNNPLNAAEWISDDGIRWAWSESNGQYERVPQDGMSFVLLRSRLERAHTKLRELGETIS